MAQHSGLTADQGSDLHPGAVQQSVVPQTLFVARQTIAKFTHKVAAIHQLFWARLPIDGVVLVEKIAHHHPTPAAFSSEAFGFVQEFVVSQSN